MTGTIDIRQELENQGLTRRTWAETLQAIKSRLPPADFEKFSRAHKNFVGYRSETTLSRFYGTVFALNLQAEINGYRFGRLEQVLTDLLPALPQGSAVLEVGAGAGFIAALVRKHCAPRQLAVYDLCAAARDELAAQGFTVLPHPVPDEPEGAGFDRILCIDSLGEVNADDDGLLSKADGVPADELPGQMEQRYGFAQKLLTWRNWLAPGGSILLWEPFAYPEAFGAVAAFLRETGWDAQVFAPEPGRNHLEIRPIPAA